MKKNLKPLPHFKNETEEREFWSNHSSSDYLDWEKAETAVFPSLKLSSETISLRLPLGLLNRIKVAAHKQGLPYQSLMKQKLFELFA